MKEEITAYINQSPEIVEAYDTSTSNFEKYRTEVEKWYRNSGLSYQEVDEEARSHSNSIGFRTAVKIAESKRVIESFDKNITVSLLNPVYKETGRMQTREQHPHGEDSIRFKVRCLRELESVNPKFSGRFVVIDDECPNHSGEVAQSILEDAYPEECEQGKYRVLFLGKGMDEGDPNIPPGITHKSGSNRSVKGGALLYGMRTVIDDIQNELHIIIDNDADLSVLPLQVGILIEDILNGNAGAVAGSRREDDSVSIIGDARDTRGQLFIGIWRYFLPDLAKTIIDTNRAFKAFESNALKKILGNIMIYTFPYQIELLQGCISNGILLGKRGIAYIDSEAASTQSGSNITETYLNQIHQIIDIALRYRTIDSDNALLKHFVSISEEKWATIEANPPSKLEDLLL